MDVMIKYFDELNDLGAQLVQQVGGDEESAKTVNSQLQKCQERWDDLVQRMEHCSKQVSPPLLVVVESSLCLVLCLLVFLFHCIFLRSKIFTTVLLVIGCQLVELCVFLVACHCMIYVCNLI